MLIRAFASEHGPTSCLALGLERVMPELFGADLICPRVCSGEGLI